VPLQPHGSKPPLYLIHGWGGDVFGFVGLAQALAPDQPVYGIQAVGLDGKAPRHTSVDQMAAHYVTEICSFQPEGPYHLGGYSLGGLIAYSVASHLHSLGHRVQMLALFDSYPVGMVSWTNLPYLKERLFYHLSCFRKTQGLDRINYLRSNIVELLSRISQRQNPGLDAPPAVSDARSNDYMSGYDYYQTLTVAHRLHPYPGTASVFCCEDSDQGIGAWKHLAKGGVSYHCIPGTHYQIITSKYVAELANAVKGALEAGQEVPCNPEIGL
jgi:thioesterase domain-containing protein